MKQIIDSLPDQILQTIPLVPASKFKRRKYDQIIICGMGGSGISGRILKVLYPDIQILLNNDYLPPRYIKKSVLAILISYSGNTEETLHNYRIFARAGTEIAIISSNGKLLKKKSNFRIRVPGNLPPRGALGYLFTPLPILLSRYGILNTDPTAKLITLANFLIKSKTKLINKARAIAKKITGKLPLIYANSDILYTAAYRWQCQFNENAKVLTHINIIPEMCHNEIVGVGNPQSINKHSAIIFLEDPKAYPRNRSRMEIIQKIASEVAPGFFRISPAGINSFQRLFWTVMLGDYISYYYAVNKGIDPLPVKRIDYLKKKLSKIK